MNRIAICGFGTVGEGVKSIIDSLPEERDVKVVKVLDLPIKKNILGDLLVTDYSLIVKDPSIDTVIECLGGDALPRKIILESLLAGKNVISSNKETLSKHYREYIEAAHKGHGTLQFEASVGGGIPLLYPLYTVSCFDRISSIRGILNGTTNFIITRMQDDGDSFANALAEAQRRGFAEKDPTADLEGLDMVRKSAIIAMLCYGHEVNPDSIPHFGITGLNDDILEQVMKKGKTIRFVADISYGKAGLSIIVIPELFGKGEPLSAVSYETNAVEAVCDKNGPLSFIGKGAGRFPTASAIIQDLGRVVDKTARLLPIPKEPLVMTPQIKGVVYAFNSGAMDKLIDPTVEELKRYQFVALEKEGSL